jgi:hypothetical protein
MAVSFVFQSKHGHGCCIAIRGNYHAIQRIPMKLEEHAEAITWSECSSLSQIAASLTARYDLQA